MTEHPIHALDPDVIARRLASCGLDHWNPAVPAAVRAALCPGAHGDLPGWLAALEALPKLPAATATLERAAVTTGRAADLNAAERRQLRDALAALHPWRKGPFSLYGVEIDAEWRSDWKWERVIRAGVTMENARILDVGSGNGYYAWRMLGAGARQVIGVDPTLIHVMQALALRHCMQAPPAAPDILPLPLEALPPGQGTFDLVFSMGVIYHRRSPLDHILALRDHLAPGGTLVLEGLVVPGDVERCLCPPGRYARMRNIHFLPSAAMLGRWLERCGLTGVTLLDESVTRPEEQRSTSWMRFESLTEALDPQDPTRTVEGHPAPRRALFRAGRPGG